MLLALSLECIPQSSIRASNIEAKRFYGLLEVMNKLLWERCVRMEFSLAIKMLSQMRTRAKVPLISEHHWSMRLVHNLRYDTFISVLFNCEWYDPRHPSGTYITTIKSMRLNHIRKHGSFDPFIIVQNVRQVYYLPYLRKYKSNWRVVTKTKARDKV